MTMNIRRSAGFQVVVFWFSRYQGANQFSLTKQWQVLVKQTGGDELHFSTSVRTSGSVHGVLWSTSRPMHLHKHRAREAWHHMASIGPSWPIQFQSHDFREFHLTAFLLSSSTAEVNSESPQAELRRAYRAAARSEGAG